MKNLTGIRISQIILWVSFCIFIVACEPTPPLTLTPHPILVLTGTVTLPQETPLAAPTEFSAWPVSPDKHLMVAQTHDGAWWMWDTASRHPIYLLNDTTLHAPPIHDPIFSPDGHYLAAISVGQVLLWEIASRKRHTLILPQTKGFRSLRLLVFSPDSRLLGVCLTNVQRRDTWLMEDERTSKE